MNINYYLKNFFYLCKINVVMQSRKAVSLTKKNLQ